MSGPTGASPHQDAEPQKGAVLGIERREPQPQFGDPFAGLRAPQGVPAPSCSPPLHALFSPHLILDISENHQNILTSAPSTVLSKDAGSYGKLIELHQQIDKTTTRLGSAALLRDILIPPASIEQILQRRAAIEELRENAELREEVRKALHSVHEVQYHGFSCEELALRFFVPDKADRWAETASIVQRFKEYMREWFNLDRKTVAELKAIGNLLDRFTAIEGAAAPLIRDLFGAVREVRSSAESPLLDGSVRRGVTGVHPPGGLPWYEPRFCLSGGAINVEVPVITAATLLTSHAITSGDIVAASQIVPLNNALYLTFGGYLTLRSFLAGDRMLPKLRARVQEVDGLFRALDAIGELDALLTLAELPERFGERGSWPQFVEGENYTLSAQEMHHPVLLLEGGSVGNDVEIRGGCTNVLTGPNSGGKTTVVTAILQNQILAQLGTAVAAREMRVTVADQILFQGPSFAALGEHGRFGTELAATKEIFRRATPHSLVILDEVGDGTTAEERTETGYGVVWGFNAVEAGTILVTHNVNLARRLAEEGIAKTLQMEFAEGAPTYRIIPGISTVSHAESVARSIGFGREDIERMVREKRPAM